MSKLKPTDWLWQFFTKVDQTKRIAKCNICNNGYKYKTVTNLKKHLDIKHPTSSEEQGGEAMKVGPRKFRSWVWKYYKLIESTSSDDLEVECTLCGLQPKTTDTSNMVKHLRVKHRHIIAQHKSGADVKNNDTESPGNEDSVESTNEHKQTCWKSSVCGEDTDGLGEGSQGGEGQKLETRSFRSWVWKYYRHIESHLGSNDPRVSCTLCGCQLRSASTSNLIKHLRVKHRDVVVQPDGGADVRNDDTEWLDNEDNIDISNEHKQLATVYITEKPKRTVLPQLRTNRDSRQADALSCDVTSTQTATPMQDDSLERFGRYAASLLRRLPPERADRLQADFICSILREQAEHTQSGANHRDVSTDS